jgi:hypothetical protein
MAICCLIMTPALVNSCASAFLVNRFKEAAAERIGDGESASNDTFKNFIETFSIRAHLLSALIGVNRR